MFGPDGLLMIFHGFSQTFIGDFDHKQVIFLGDEHKDTLLKEYLALQDILLHCSAGTFFVIPRAAALRLLRPKLSAELQVCSSSPWHPEPSSRCSPDHHPGAFLAFSTCYLGYGLCCCSSSTSSSNTKNSLFPLEL